MKNSWELMIKLKKVLFYPNRNKFYQYRVKIVQEAQKILKSKLL